MAVMNKVKDTVGKYQSGLIQNNNAQAPNKVKEIVGNFQSGLLQQNATPQAPNKVKDIVGRWQSGVLDSMKEPTNEPTITPNVTDKNSYYDPSQAYADAYAARQQALDANYQAALGQLKNSYNASVNDLRTQGDEALRQAYINMMMNKRGINQDLEAAGLTGGATESAMARLYNNYANDRNAIARQIDQSLTQMGNNYGNNVANLGMNYNTNYADAIADYQNQVANARMNLANLMARTGSKSTGTTNDVIASTLKMYKDNPVSARRYLTSRGITGNAADEYLWAAGIDPADTYEGGQTSGLTADNSYLNGTPTGVTPQQNATSLTGGTLPNSGDLSNEMWQYRMRNYTPAAIRGMSPYEAYAYVDAMPVDNATKAAILQDGGFDLDELANMF